MLPRAVKAMVTSTADAMQAVAVSLRFMTTPSCSTREGCGSGGQGRGRWRSGLVAVPVDGRGDDVVPSGCVAADLLAEGRVVDDERGVELVVGVEQLTDVAVEQSERAQHRPLERRQSGASRPGCGVDRADDVPGAAGV